MLKMLYIRDFAGQPVGCVAYEFALDKETGTYSFKYGASFQSEMDVWNRTKAKAMASGRLNAFLNGTTEKRLNDGHRKDNSACPNQILPAGSCVIQAKNWKEAYQGLLLQVLERESVPRTTAKYIKSMLNPPDKKNQKKSAMNLVSRLSNMINYQIDYEDKFSLKINNRTQVRNLTRQLRHLIQNL